MTDDLRALATSRRPPRSSADILAGRRIAGRAVTRHLEAAAGRTKRYAADQSSGMVTSSGISNSIHGKTVFGFSMIEAV